jgi:very-short-patch-repair endonuclease
MYDALACLRPTFELVPQHQIGPYRVDIAILGAKIVVECDGHAFHAMTKEQVARDNKRDRYLQSEGWRVLRFSGSEIHNRLSACADEVIAMAVRGTS